MHYKNEVAALVDQVHLNLIETEQALTMIFVYMDEYAEQLASSKGMPSELPENPYPETLFVPTPDKELDAVIKLLRDNGYSPDNLFGNWGRKVWNNCIEAVNQSLPSTQLSKACPSEEVTELINTLVELVDLKDHKDKHGKTSLYIKEQPKLWLRARIILERVKQSLSDQGQADKEGEE